MAEKKISFAIISEPICILKENWASSTDGLAAIHWRPALLRSRCRVIASGKGFVAIGADRIVIFFCYVSANTGLSALKASLRDLKLIN